MDAIIELLPNFPTDFEMQIGGDRHIACIKKAVDIPPKQQSVARFVRAAVGIGANVSRFECGQWRH